MRIGILRNPVKHRLALLFLLLACAFALPAKAAPLSGTKSVGPTGNYASLTAAIADIQAQTVGGALILELQPAYVSTVETFPLTVPTLNGASAVKTVTIRPASGSVGLSITSADTTAATVDLNGAAFVMLDGRPGGAGVAKQLAIENTSTGGVALRFINEASSNTVKHLTLQGVNTSAFSGTVVFSTTTGANGNDNNTIDTCDIRDGASTPANGIYAEGTGATTAQNNSGNLITNCNIFNFYRNTAVDSAGVAITSGNTGWIISGNSFYQTVSRVGVTGVVRAIYLSNTSDNSHSVTGNFIGGSAPNAGGTAWTTTGNTLPYVFVGIWLRVGNATPTSVQGNVIRNIAWNSSSTASAPPGVWSGIHVETGQANIGTVTGNTIGSGTGTGSISAITGGNGGTAFGIGSASTLPVAISNNTIGSITTNGTTTGVSVSVTGIRVTNAPATIAGNTVGSTTTANSLRAATGSSSNAAQQVTGITYGGSGATITGNTVANLSNSYFGTSSAGQIQGIVTNSGVNTVTGNTVRNFSTTSQTAGFSVVGISQFSTSVGQTVSQNVVHSLANTSATAPGGVVGIYYTGTTTGGTNVIARNLVHSLSTASTSASAELSGMRFDSGTFTAQNNMVRVGLDASGVSTAGAAAARGIYDNDNGASIPRNFIHNSVYVGGTATSGATSTFAFSSSSQVNARDFRNNIFVNARSNSGGTGKHYAVTYGGVGVNPFGLNSTTNIFFVNGTGGVLGRYNGVDQATLAAWQTATGGDGASLNADPVFVNPTGTAASVDLHLQTSSPASDTGTPITGVTSDFDGDLRSLTTPDIGADEFLSPNANLTGITLSVGGLSPSFNANTLSYTASVSNSTGTLTFTPARSDAGATVTVNGGSAATPVTLTVGGSNVVNITVTAQDGTMKTYAVTVTRRTVFQDWALANGVSSDPSVVGANSLANLQNFAFGLDPNSGAAGVLVFNGTFGAGGTIGARGLPDTRLEPVVNGVDFRVIFIRRKDSVNAGLTYAPEFAATLAGPWTASAALPTVLADGGTYQVVSVPFPPFIGGKKARFMRVRTTLAP